MSIFDKFKKKSKSDEVQIKDFMSTEEIKEHLLGDILPATLACQVQRQGDVLYLPELNTELSVNVNMPDPRQVGLEFFVFNKSFAKHFYEYSAGAGTDTRSAVGMAVSSFVFCFMDGYKRMIMKEEPTALVTDLAGKHHEWNCYISDTISVGMGDKEKDCSGELRSAFWELLEPELKKRLGNQRVSFVKVYAARFPENAIGEVRIDDVEIHELSEMVRRMAETWKAQQFVSTKQFFFIEQNAESYMPSLYDGPDGFQKMRSHVVEYLKLFAAADTQELYGRLGEDAAAKIGDATLAWECYCFLTEVAAMNAFMDKVKVSDIVKLVKEDGSETEICLSSLSDYNMLCDCLKDIINKRDFGEHTDKLWQELVTTSSICNVLNNALNSGSKLENLCILHMSFMVSKDFELR